MMRKISIVAVHGTFATDAPWTKASSAFAGMLERELPEYRISWHSCNWSGANSHRERELAADELRRQLTEISRSGEDNIHVIGHSHGGNIALMCLCLPQILPFTVRSVTCISTPFFIAEPKDIEHFLEASHGSLTLKPLFLLSLLYFASLEFLSDLIPSITSIGMTLYAFLLVLAAGTAAAVYAMRGKLSQQQLLWRYKYSDVSQPILCLRTSLDEAFHLLNVSAMLACVPVVPYWFIIFLFFLLIPFASFIGWVFIIPLIILAPLIYLSGQSIRFLVRAAPWTMGEGLLHGVLVNFATKNVLSHPNAKNVIISVSALETYQKLILRHSALYSSEAAAEEIASFIRAASGKGNS